MERIHNPSKFLVKFKWLDPWLWFGGIFTKKNLIDEQNSNSLRFDLTEIWPSAKLTLGATFVVNHATWVKRKQKNTTTQMIIYIAVKELKKIWRQIYVEAKEGKDLEPEDDIREENIYQR